MSELLALHDLGKDYDTDAGPVSVLKHLTLGINEGEFVAIMGPSGSGKSTLMNILGCLDVPTSGSYVLDGRDVGVLGDVDLARVRSEVIGFVFQGFNLLPRATLVANVALPLVYQRIGRGIRNARAATMLERVGLKDWLNSLPPRISGGQQQRVAIARALVTEPRLILADEPTGNLDTRTGREIMQLFQRINHDSGMTMVVVTHDHNVASFASRLVYLLDGRIHYDGPVDDFREEGLA
ncbi:MAG: macrolide ABC transporter ATP-binding protein [Zetaproteobacteria bacterium CG12_big_fil_rev_8_21_14_0_65_55_1124]|nr:MAG: macrolide ABC transporter ATP-binding protein [Zetaproteobacteria bacterium CG1_02_55_237]PIS19359.1 MAG: macrolide ABC transporter ATP-binding protein [Zetaproteobacteria bacterium CG08_land_8_20_14_0_20_55_17]PIW43405.1 MAG: macrolide ABC transporter ATP-binding protein [Zetaproteobacteria bacterium CG12_big_fil_rev_8_21_14_0_65_55_1124]PIY53600.1 MAG: macrolide ABC transporter ATP-binding protein [Zetaproteobacteria bacterium CG_4_10_14_0_8_um_filter_55_43]PIZ37259.1 MAG: macrolide A